MNTIMKINQLESLNPNTLVLLDDEKGGVSLGMKSNESFNQVDFKFKELNYKNKFIGVILLKLDEKCYSCFIPLMNFNDLSSLKQLINLDYFNLIVFSNYNDHKIYRIQSDLKYKLLINNFNKKTNNVPPANNSSLINELNSLFTPEVLWNN